jgi:hypothetical protein
VRAGVIFVLAIGIVQFGGTASAATSGKSLDGRTRSFVKMLHDCQNVTGAAIGIVRANPNDLLGASKAVNEAKGICQTISDRMAVSEKDQFSDQALDGEVAVDYYTRGLGRFSNYIDNGLPSDVTKASEYFSTARSAFNSCLRGINQRRAIYGLSRLK